MPGIILVCGVSNSGKTRSIRQFLERRKIFHMKRGDITAVLPIQKNGKELDLGVASGGDTLNIVKKNLAFIDRHDWDIIVCASKSRGQTVRFVEDFARRNGVRLVMINTMRVKGTAKYAANKNIAAQIERNLR
jgi:hypothetical protein